MKCISCDAESINGRRKCSSCWNAIRRDRYRKSICKKCLKDFSPGSLLNKIYCSELCRFMDKVLVTNECWIWNGYLNDGVGFFVNSGSKTNRIAHRVSYELHKSIELKDENFIRHSCRTRGCVNPEHLYISGSELTKKCNTCLIIKNVDEFRKQRNSCKKCQHKERLEKYRLSICKHCEKDYKAYKKGCGQFCSIKCRFMHKVRIVPGLECWLWKGHRNKTGYGVIGQGIASRMAYKIFNHDFDESLHVLHLCDTPPCVNPKHLKLGTPQDNMNDLKERGVSQWKEKLNNLKIS